MQNVPCDYDTIKKIVHTEEYAQIWCQHNPSLYLDADGEPYGLITAFEWPDPVDREMTTWIASTTTHPSHPFTVAMVRDIIRMYKAGRICLVTDDPDYHDHIRVALLRYNMRYEVVGSTLYSYNY